MAMRPADRHHRFSLRTGIALLVPTLVGLLGALWLSGWRWVARVTSWSELESYYLPKYEYAAERLAAGSFPLWDPFDFCGIPLLATLQSSIVYPPMRLIYSIFPADYAYAPFFFLHLALASIFTLALARSVGCSLWPSILAATWVVQPTWVVRMYDNPEFLASVIWIPGLVLLAGRVFSHPGARSSALLACLAAIQLVSGYPPFSFATLYLLVLGVPFWLFDWRRRPGPTPLPSIAGSLTVAVVLTALLAAIQVLPTLDHLAATNREELSSSMQASWLEISERSPATLSLIHIRAATVGRVAADWFKESGPILLLLGLVAPFTRLRSGAIWYLFVATLLFSFLPLSVIQRLPLYQFVRSGLEWN
jgi:hypothetical protein